MSEPGCVGSGMIFLELRWFVGAYLFGHKCRKEVMESGCGGGGVTLEQSMLGHLRARAN